MATITAAELKPTKPLVVLPGHAPPTEVHATFDDGHTAVLFTYYADEITFRPEEFVGLTEAGARALFARRDRAWFQR